MTDGTWRDVPGYPFRADEAGNIEPTDDAPLHPEPDGKRTIFRHRGTLYPADHLIALAYHGPQPHPSSNVRHLNGNHRDDHPANLAWAPAPPPPPTEPETWAPVPAFTMRGREVTGIEASTHGRLRRGGTILEPNGRAGGKDGHYLTAGGLYIHRLVAMAYHGPPPFPGATVGCENGNKTDTRPANLAWMTLKQNRAHAASLGLTANNRRRAKLTTTQVHAIRESAGVGTAALAQTHGVSASTIRDILQGRTWAGPNPRERTHHTTGRPPGSKDTRPRIRRYFKKPQEQHP